MTLHGVLNMENDACAGYILCFFCMAENLLDCKMLNKKCSQSEQSHIFIKENLFQD